MAISFVRIDDRVIHGQLVTRWSKHHPCDGIIAVDDGVAADSFLKNVMQNAAPTGTKVWIFSVKEALEKLDKVIASQKKYFIIAKSPTTLKLLIEGGIDLSNSNNDSINVGPMSARKGTVTIASNACVLPEEIDAFNFLEAKGFNIEFRLVPDSTQKKWEEIK